MREAHGRIFMFVIAKRMALTDPTQPEFEVWYYDAKAASIFWLPMGRSFWSTLTLFFTPWKTHLTELYFKVTRKETPSHEEA